MKTKIIYSAVVIAILMVTHIAFAQLTDLEKIKILDRVEALFKVESYPQAFTEVQKVLEWDPENVTARYWEARILFSRKKITNADAQFDLLVADMEFLDTVRVENTLLANRIRQLQQAYNQQFATLIIRAPDIPMVGYYVAELKMKFLSQIKLSPLQRIRLTQINAYFDSLGKLYFDHFNPRDSIFECHIKAFPVIPQRIRTARYRVVLPQTGDTLSLVFNRSRKRPLTLVMDQITNLYYQLPPEYTVLFVEGDEKVKAGHSKQSFIYRKVGQYQAVLVPLDETPVIQFGQAPGWIQRGIMWGGILGATFFLYQLAR